MPGKTDSPFLSSLRCLPPALPYPDLLRMFLALSLRLYTSTSCIGECKDLRSILPLPDAACGSFPCFGRTDKALPPHTILVCILRFLKNFPPLFYFVVSTVRPHRYFLCSGRTSFRPGTYFFSTFPFFAFFNTVMIFPLPTPWWSCTGVLSVSMIIQLPDCFAHKVRSLLNSRSVSIGFSAARVPNYGALV